MEPLDENFEEIEASSRAKWLQHYRGGGHKVMSWQVVFLFSLQVFPIHPSIHL